VKTEESPSVDRAPPGALFQVGEQAAVPLAHLDRVNPDLSPEERARILALAPGKSTAIERDGASVRVRRTR
jgi:hypothetical protein